MTEAEAIAEAHLRNETERSAEAIARGQHWAPVERGDEWDIALREVDAPADDPFRSAVRRFPRALRGALWRGLREMLWDWLTPG